MLRSALSKVDRGVSVVLAVVWLIAGVAGLVVGTIHASLPLLVASALVVAWGVAWSVVAWRGRLLGSSVPGASRGRHDTRPR